MKPFYSSSRVTRTWVISGVLGIIALCSGCSTTSAPITSNTPVTAPELPPNPDASVATPDMVSGIGSTGLASYMNGYNGEQ